MLYIYMGEETGERNHTPVRAPPRRDSIRKGIMGRILSSTAKIYYIRSTNEKIFVRVSMNKSASNLHHYP